MPATPIKPLITDAGLAAAIAAQGTGLTLQITHVQIGTGAYTLNDADGSPDRLRTALVAPVEKNVIAGGYRDGTRFRVDVLFEPWNGAPTTYGVSEIGFWAGDPDAGGTLFAIAASPVPFAQRNMLTYLATFHLQIKRANPDAVSLVIDPDLALALALVADHESSENPHPQYLNGAAHLGAVDPHLQYKKHQFLATVQCNLDTALTAAAAAGNLVIIGAFGATVTLPPSAGMRPGETVSFIVQGVGGTIVRHGTDTIALGASLALTSLALSASDGCELTYTGDGKWVVSGGSLLTTRTGEVAMVLGTTAKPGTITANGPLLSRITFARLWAYAQASGNLSASDAAWVNETGKFSPGDGVTTFRAPDLRGHVLRMLDLGRGTDPGRAIGSIQADQNLTHSHTITVDNGGFHGHGLTIDAVGNHQHGYVGQGINTPGGGEGGGRDSLGNLAMATDGAGAHAHTGTIAGDGTHAHAATAGASGGTEVRVKNIAVLPCIYY